MVLDGELERESAVSRSRWVSSRSLMPPDLHPSDESASQPGFGRARRWVDVRVPSLAAVTVLLAEVARRSPSPIRLGGPITSLVLASLLDSPRGDLAACGITAWVETDRRDDRRDGWTTDRVGLQGRWVLFDQVLGIVASGSSADGIPPAGHPVWRELTAQFRPPDIDVQAWQRVDRTTWVLHDGDGDMFAELVIDEQRRMGTHEASVEARLVSPSHHRIFDALIEPLNACFGVIESSSRATGRTVMQAQDAEWERTIGVSDAPRESDGSPLVGSPLVVGEPESADVGQQHPIQPEGGSKLDDLSWVIRAAVDVDAASRSRREPNGKYLRSVAGLVGAAPAMRALYAEAGQYLDAMLPDLISAESALVRAGDEAWAVGRLARVVGPAWDHMASPAEVGSDALAARASTLRSMVLAMLEQPDPAGQAARAILTTGLTSSVEAWITAHRNQRKPLDISRTAALRVSISAYRLAGEANSGSEPSHLAGTQAGIHARMHTLVVGLDQDLRWVRRRTAALNLIDRATATPALPLTPIQWMRVGVYANELRATLAQRLARARRRAQRLQRELSRIH
jgi:hypothetical protein